MILSLIIISFLFLSSLALNFWLILFTLPWKDRTIDHFVQKFRRLFEKKWQEMLPEERIELWKVYNDTSTHYWDNDSDE